MKTNVYTLYALNEKHWLKKVSIYICWIFFLCFSYIADFQVIDACRSFIDKNSQELKEKNLERNFLLHLINLHDFNLITSSQIEEITGKLRDVGKSLVQWRVENSVLNC